LGGGIGAAVSPLYQQNPITGAAIGATTGVGSHLGALGGKAMAETAFRRNIAPTIMKRLTTIPAAGVAGGIVGGIGANLLAQKAFSKHSADKQAQVIELAAILTEMKKCL
jgi:hypothetical protein